MYVLIKVIHYRIPPTCSLSDQTIEILTKFLISKTILNKCNNFPVSVYNKTSLGTNSR